MIAARAQVKRKVRYPLLTNIELILDASGLATNTNNSFGQVDASNVLVSLKSVSPGVTGRDFSVIGTGVTFDPATKSIALNGSGTIRSTGAASVYDFMSFNAGGLVQIKWTAFIVCKIGTVIKPAASSYGLIGNNGGSTLNKGILVSYGNNSATTEDLLQTFVTRGTSAQYLGRMVVGGAAPSNQYCVIAVQMDGSQDGANANNRMRLFINDQALLFNEPLQNNTAPVTTPTYALEIGGVGNGAAPLIGNIKEVIITSTVTSFTSIIGVIRALMNKHGIVRSRADGLSTSLVPQIFTESAGTAGLEYHLCGVIGQNPVDKQEVFSCYSEGGSHVYAANKKLVGRKSIYKAAPGQFTFDAQADIYNPAGADAIQDCGGGYDSNGVFHIFVDVINSAVAGGCIGARHIYSSDLSSWTNTDITASLAADGLLAWRMYGNMIHVGGVWLKGYYKATDQGNITQSANYVLRSTDGVNWTSVTVRAPAAAYINEPTVFWLGGNNIGYLARNEVTGEWSLSLSTDLGLTWDAMTDVAFGETVVSANPPMVKTFMHNGQLVVAAYITNRNNDTAFVIYGLPANIIASRGAGWDLGTKLMWFKTGLAPFHYQYGDAAHLDDTLKAVGLWTYDQFPGAGAGTVSKMYYTVMPTWDVARIESELGI